MNELIYTPLAIFSPVFAALAKLIEVKIKWHQSANILKASKTKEEKGGT